MWLLYKVNVVAVLLIIQLHTVLSDSRVLYAVNAGGASHVDSNGINFLADPISVGTESDFGTRLPIRRAAGDDQILYQTERWHEHSFHYTIPVHDDGDFVLVLKFAEVYFYGPDMKVFDVKLNDQHMVVKDLDIFNLVGNSVAYDEIIPFSIKKGKLSVNGEFSTISTQLKVEFVKGARDNPKICAFYLMKGNPEDVYRLPELTQEGSATLQPKTPTATAESDEDEDEDFPPNSDSQSSSSSQKDGGSSGARIGRKEVKSGRPADDPYKDDHTSLIIPIVISLSVFVPTVLFMCRL